MFKPSHYTLLNTTTPTHPTNPQHTGHDNPYHSTQ